MKPLSIALQIGECKQCCDGEETLAGTLLPMLLCCMRGALHSQPHFRLALMCSAKRAPSFPRGR